MSSQEKIGFILVPFPPKWLASLPIWKKPHLVVKYFLEITITQDETGNKELF
jgi:hypothetical protein